MEVTFFKPGGDPDYHWPGPLAPPLSSRPSLNITARSYSCTTFQMIFIMIIMIIMIRIIIIIVLLWSMFCSLLDLAILFTASFNTYLSYHDQAWLRGTLKQTQRLKGSVKMTMTQEMAVRSQPQRPIPVSTSSPKTVGKLKKVSINISLTFLQIIWRVHMSQLLLLGKVEYGGGPIFKVVLEC